MKKVISILENKWVSAFCLIAAIANRTINILFVSYAGRDKMIGVMQSKSFLEGKGFVIPQYFFTAPDQVVYDATPYWPPGYPLFLSPFLKLFSFDIYQATTAFDWVFAIILIFLIRKLLRVLEFNSAAITIGTLIAGCFEYTFISESLPTDLPALVFLVAAFILVIQSLKNTASRPGYWVLAGLFLFLPNLFRYAYPAITIGIPAGILLLGFMNKDKAVRIRGWVMLSTALACMALFFLYMRTSTGMSNYALPTERGIFPGNLLHWHPSAPASFINIAFLSSQVILRLGIPLSILLTVLEWINILVWAVLGGWLAWLFFLQNYFRTMDPWKWFVWLGAISVGGIFLSLGYLSLTYKMQQGFVGGWNYIYESRYYAFVFLFLQFLFLKGIFQAKGWQRWPVIAAGILLFIEIGHNIYFHTKVALAFNEYKQAVYREQDYNMFGQLLDELKRSDTGADIIVTSYKDNYYPYTAIYHGYKGFMDARTLLQSMPVVKKKTIMVLVLYSEDVPAFQTVLAGKNVKEWGRFEYTRFYIVDLGGGDDTN